MFVAGYCPATAGGYAPAGTPPKLFTKFDPILPTLLVKGNAPTFPTTDLCIGNIPEARLDVTGVVEKLAPAVLDPTLFTGLGVRFGCRVGDPFRDADGVVLLLMLVVAFPPPTPLLLFATVAVAAEADDGDTDGDGAGIGSWSTAISLAGRDHFHLLL